jgi:hypothetical protein
VTEPAPTHGVAVVDEAVALLDGLADRPVAEHVPVLDEVHRRLQDALATLDEA